MRLRRTRRGYEEERPAVCARCGEPFVPGEFTVGIQHCTCDLLMHRSRWCPHCRRDTYTPAMGRQCRPRSLDGR